MNTTNQQQQRRKTRISKKVRGTAEKPRLSVFRSNEALYAQLIDDVKGHTLLGVSEKALKTSSAGLGKESSKSTKTEKAKALGMEFAKAALAKKVKAVVFDKGYYRYHGRVKAFAEGVREGGLKF